MNRFHLKLTNFFSKKTINIKLEDINLLLNQAHKSKIIIKSNKIEEEV